jgi:hypothetical protein
MTYIPQGKQSSGNGFQFIVHREQDTYQLPPLDIQQVQQPIAQQPQPQIVQEQTQSIEEQPEPQIVQEVAFQQEKDHEDTQIVEKPQEPGLQLFRILIINNLY